MISGVYLYKLSGNVDVALYAHINMIRRWNNEKMHKVNVVNHKHVYILLKCRPF